MIRRAESAVLIALLALAWLPAAAHAAHHESCAATMEMQHVAHHQAEMELMEGGECCDEPSVSGTCCESEMPMPDAMCAASGACCFVESKPGQPTNTVRVGQGSVAVIVVSAAVTYRAGPAPPGSTATAVPFSKPVFELKTDLRI